METRLKGIMADLFGVSTEDISDESSPETLDGWDSMKHLVLVTAIEESFDILMTTDEVIRINKFRDIIQILESKCVN